MSLCSTCGPDSDSACHALSPTLPHALLPCLPPRADFSAEILTSEIMLKEARPFGAFDQFSAGEAEPGLLGLRLRLS